MEPKRPKLTPEEKYVQKECQDAEIAALKQKLVDMEAKLMRVTAELQKVKDERAYDKINFEIVKCELESKIGKYKEQCSELQSENEKLRSRTTKEVKDERAYDKINFEIVKCELESKIGKYKEQCSELQSENEKLRSRTTKVDEDSCCMNALPNEIIQKIFSYLTQNQLGQIARVCRKWNLMTKSPVLWRKVNVEIYRSPDSENDAKSFNSLIDGLPSCVTFLRLDFVKRGYLDFEKLCMKLHQNNPNVEALILARCDMSTNLFEVISGCTQFLQGLKKLVLHSCRFKDYYGSAELEDNSTIEVLDLNCSDFKSYSVIHFSKLHSLKELRLASTHVASKRVNDDWFVGDASLLNQLQVLELRNTLISEAIFLAIKRHGQNLKELYLCDLCLRDHDVNFNSTVFPHLQTLCIRHTPVSGEGLVSLIRSCPSLVSVYVDEDVARSFSEHPFVVANRCKSGIVKSIDFVHDHDVDYLHD